MNKIEISKTLAQMVEEDQSMHTEFQRGRGRWDESIDERNTKVLKKIINEVG